MGVLFAQYASEMRRVPETLIAREQTWAYQLLQISKSVYSTAKELTKSAYQAVKVFLTSKKENNNDQSN